MWDRGSSSRDMNAFQHAFVRTLRHAYDTEKQIAVSLSIFDTSRLAPGLGELLGQIGRQSHRQISRLDEIFRVLYLEPRGQASWAATALLRDAWDAAASEEITCSEAFAASLLALKRYELSLYEALFRWSATCALDEALPGLRRCIAEELMQTALLAEYAFERPAGLDVITGVQTAALH